ncbi:hypothetical protein OG230_31850 [Streptomyces sp. NBC_00234]|uniref:hypothetical protein n=1 Tax=Streptomyces sp. NBC_00234 TaxID=2903638 RepID=UPI002E29E4C1|nr:hypothetical protein [Streptomyces sp. NBC_00234]
MLEAGEPFAALPIGQVPGVAENAFDLLRDTESLRLAISMRAPQGQSRIAVDADREGNCTGTFDLGPMQRGDIIRVAGEATSYVRYSDASLAAMRAAGARRGPEAAARANERTAQARGKYLKMVSASAEVQDQCDLDKALSSVPRSGQGVRQGTAVERDGERLVPLSGPQGDGGMRMYVAVDGMPYLRFMEGQSEGVEMTLEFSRYGERVHAVAPPASMVVVMPTGSGGLLDT